MAAAKIKKGDNVVVRSGKDKGRTGTVLQVLPKEDKVVVAGVNIAARHRKPSQRTRRAASTASKLRCDQKVAVADKDGKATRVRFETRDGKKVRVAVKSGEAIDG
jgi:large subunit ribosomal protein L24